MDNSYTSNAFLFSFEGRINRAKYWYAIVASSVACMVFLSIVAYAIGGIKRLVDRPVLCCPDSAQQSG